MRILLLLTLFASAQGVVPTQLKESVQSYWDALASGNPAGALSHVHPDDLNNFLKRKPPQFTSWRLVNIEMLDEGRARVTVSIDRIFLNGAQLPHDVNEIWERNESKWALRVEPTKELLQKVYRRDDRPPMPAELRVSPEVIRFYQVAPQQPGTITIQNGLDSAVEIEKIEFDEDLFEIRNLIAEVPPKSTRRILLDYPNKVEGDNLKSMLRLTLNAGSEVRTFEIPIVYNYSDDLTRWIRSLPKPAPSKQKIPE